MKASISGMALVALVALAPRPVLAAPITGIWALWVMRKVLREVRFRLMGRLAAAGLADWAEGLADTRPEWRRALLLLIGNRITLFGE